MIVLYVAFFIFAYSVYFIYLLFTGRHSTQVHERNEALKEENERLKEQLKKK